MLFSGARAAYLSTPVWCLFICWVRSWDVAHKWEGKRALCLYPVVSVHKGDFIKVLGLQFNREQPPCAVFPTGLCETLSPWGGSFGGSWGSCFKKNECCIDALAHGHSTDCLHKSHLFSQHTAVCNITSVNTQYLYQMFSNRKCSSSLLASLCIIGM